MQFAYLFERFPSFTQTFCAQEVVEMDRAGAAAWVFAIRDPRCRGGGRAARREEESEGDEGMAAGPDFLPAELLARVRYLPAPRRRITEFRWLGRNAQLSEALWTQYLHWRRTRAAAPAGQRGAFFEDGARFYEAGLLGWRLVQMGVGHLHVHFAGLAARTAYWIQQFYGVSYSFTAHANDVFRPPDPHWSVSLEQMVAAARFVVSVSDFSVDQLRGRFPAAAGRIHRVYNGVDLGAFSPAAAGANPPLIVGVGRLIEKKGFADLVAACARLRTAGTRFEAVILGDGPLREPLRAAVAAAGLEDRVRLLGAVPRREVAAWLARARVFALPCVEEADGGMDNLPTVIAEAAASGLPVVSTTLAGVPEMVRDGETGRLVPPGDPGALAGALAPFLTDPALATRDGRAGREHALRLFSAPDTATQLRSLLRRYTSARIAPEQDGGPGRPLRWWRPGRRRAAASGA